MILIENIFKCLVWPKMEEKKKNLISEPSNHHQIDTRKPTHDHPTRSAQETHPPIREAQFDPTTQEIGAIQPSHPPNWRRWACHQSQSPIAIDLECCSIHYFNTK